MRISDWSSDVCSSDLERLIAAGQDVQLHLHPMWLNFENGAMKPDQTVSDHCYDLDIEPLTELLLDGCDTVEEWTGRRPSSMRTGNFSTAMNVYLAMQRAGLRTASNLCIAAQRSAGPTSELPSLMRI